MGNEKFVAVAPNLPDIPEPIMRCLEGRVKLPRGDWTVSMVNRVIQQYQAREDKLEGCMRDVVAFYQTLQQGLGGPKRKGLFR